MTSLTKAPDGLALSHATDQPSTESFPSSSPSCAPCALSQHFLLDRLAQALAKLPQLSYLDLANLQIPDDTPESEWKILWDAIRNHESRMRVNLAAEGELRSVCLPGYHTGDQAA